MNSQTLKLPHTNDTYRSLSGYNYTYLIFNEAIYFNNQTVEQNREWIFKNWHMSLIYVIIYIFIVFVGREYMKNKEKYNLKGLLITWNLLLTVFSTIGTIRVWPEFIHELKYHGLYHTICNKSFAYGVTGYWSYLFILSKLPELIDTIFIVLRKQKLIFLHW